MKFFRNHFLGRLLGLFTGIVFLNLSFILTEINTFDLKGINPQLYDNIVKMVCGIGAEEEKDISGEKSDTLEKEVSVSFVDPNSVSPEFYLILKGIHQSEVALKLLPGNSEITIPPPKQV